MKLGFPFWGKLIFILSLVVVILGFFYFEFSLILRILVILLGLFGLGMYKRDPEILILIILYLGLYDCYNIRYGLALPLVIILLAVLGLSSFLFYMFAWSNQIIQNLAKERFFLYLVTAGLVILEIFLAMSFWPVDPKIKSLVIVVVFYLISKIFYLYAHNMLNLKRTIGFIMAGIIVLISVIVFNWWFGLKGGL